MDFDNLKKAIDINGVNRLVFNKADVLDDVERWCLLDGINQYEFESGEDMQHWIKESLKERDIDIMFSSSKDCI